MLMFRINQILYANLTQIFTHYANNYTKSTILQQKKFERSHMYFSRYDIGKKRSNLFNLPYE